MDIKLIQNTRKATAKFETPTIELSSCEWSRFKWLFYEYLSRECEHSSKSQNKLLRLFHIKYLALWMGYQCINKKIILICWNYSLAPTLQV